MRRLRQKRGFAMIAVLGIVLTMMIYLLAVQGAVEMTRSQGRLTAQRQDATENLAALLTLALAANPAAGAPAELQTPAGGRGIATREALPAGHAFWSAHPALRPLAGDELLTLELRGAPGGVLSGRYLVNRQGLRPGVVALDSAEIGRPTATTEKGKPRTKNPQGG